MEVAVAGIWGDVVEGKRVADGKRCAELQPERQVHEHGAQLPLSPSQNTGQHD